MPGNWLQSIAELHFIHTLLQWCLLAALMAAPAVSLANERLGSGHCQLRLLGPEDEGELPSKYEDTIAKPVDTYRTVIEEALALMPRLTCAAVQRAVFVRNVRGHAGEEGWVDPNDSDLVNINLDTMDPLRRAGEDLRLQEDF
jgi:hypothetical protein